MGAVDEEFRRYVGRMPGAREAFTTDATYAMQMKFIRRMLETVDMAMEDEGVSPSARQRVIRMVLFGSPDPDAAETRQIELREIEKTLSNPDHLLLSRDWVTRP